MSADDLAAFIESTTKASGVPVVPTDPVALAAVATILVTAAPAKKCGRRRHE
jgi:hypothetical protein